jgi:hypothetical protein
MHLLTSISYSVYQAKPTGDPERDRLEQSR